MHILQGIETVKEVLSTYCTALLEGGESQYLLWVKFLAEEVFAKDILIPSLKTNIHVFHPALVGEIPRFQSFAKEVGGNSAHQVFKLM